MTLRKSSEIFDRKREAQKNELQEDYVEMIDHLISQTGEARASDLASAFGVSSAAVNGAITRLKKDGLVHSAPYRSVFLTEEGKELAKKCAKRHKLVVDFLLLLGVSRANAEQDAEGLEHYLSEETLGKLKFFIHNKGRSS